MGSEDESGQGVIFHNGGITRVTNMEPETFVAEYILVILTYK